MVRNPQDPSIHIECPRLLYHTCIGSLYDNLSAGAPRQLNLIEYYENTPNLSSKSYKYLIL